MKAYWIDTPNGQITEVEYNGDWRTIAPEWLKCDLFTAVYLNDKGDCVLVDDEGLINGNPNGWFILKHYGQPLRGYGLVQGTGPAGETTAPRMTLAELRAMVHFPTYVNEALIDREIHVTALSGKD